MTITKMEDYLKYIIANTLLLASLIAALLYTAFYIFFGHNIWAAAVAFVYGLFAASYVVWDFRRKQ